MRRDDSTSLLTARPSDVRRDGSLVLNATRCPPIDFPSGCTFAVRLAHGGPLDGWSPFSEPVPSTPSPLVPEGGARYEVRFAAEDPVGAKWDGSLAEHFQDEAAKQMSVSPTSLRIVERYGEGRYLVFDLLPLELGIEHLTARLLGALRDYPERLGAAQLRRILHRGKDELLWEASSKGRRRTGGGGFGTLVLIIILPAAICTMLGLSARRQRHTASAMIANGMPPMHRGFANASNVRVRYAAECGDDGDDSEVALTLSGVRSIADLKRIIVDRMPRAMPPNAELLISFQDSEGEQRQLSSPTMRLDDVLCAECFDVSCTHHTRKMISTPSPAPPMEAGQGGDAADDQREGDGEDGDEDEDEGEDAGGEDSHRALLPNVSPIARSRPASTQQSPLSSIASPRIAVPSFSWSKTANLSMD